MLMFYILQFVVVGGSPRRMEKFAYAIAKAMKHEIPTGQKLTNISGNTDRFAMFKVGPVLAVSVSFIKVMFFVWFTFFYKIA